MTTLTQTVKVKVADECWIALALLHRENPERSSFSASEILDRLEKERAHPTHRAGIQVHIYLHNVANLPPNSARYRMFYRLEDGSCRLYKPGDTTHPDRRGKTKPTFDDLPEHYQSLLQWYETEYCVSGSESSRALRQDPILEARGLGQEIWRDLQGDIFVEQLRSRWFDPTEEKPTHNPDFINRREKAWKRVADNAGETFYTVTKLPFTYRVEGNSGLWFYRAGRRINKRLSRGDFDKAVDRCPLQKVTDIRDCFDPSYLFALLNDKRIRGNDW
jgi:hypothetical protein